MPPARVRPFVRGDRDQVTELANAHIAAVVPNASISVQALMSHLERDPGEFIVDPWVEERMTLVAEQRGRIVAAAHLLRYGRDPRVSQSYRGTGEIRWLLSWPAASFWPDAEQAGDALATACLAQLDRWRVDRCYADGTLPVPGVYGVPEQWPHVRAIYERAGFRADGRVEVVYIGTVADLPRPGPAPLPGVPPQTGFPGAGSNLPELDAVKRGLESTHEGTGESTGEGAADAAPLAVVDVPALAVPGRGGAGPPTRAAGGRDL